MALFNDVLNSARYNPKIRPLVNQTATLEVSVMFELLSVVELDDVKQSFTCNGFLGFGWVDEMLKWDKDQYGGQDLIHPVPEDIWRPRVVIMNTLGDRDPFGDDVAHGLAAWTPGALLTTSCKLDMTYYPFDHQSCTVQILAMTLSIEEMKFVASQNKVALHFFTINGEWEYLDSSLTTSPIGAGTWIMSSIDITFFLKRRPTFLLINIILPVVFLSFLNLLVFLIPVESGEKISYGITVLLALSVYMSMVSSMLPSSSLTTPKLTLYLFILLIISMLTVIDSIIIVFLNNLEEREVAHPKAQQHFKSANSKDKNTRRAIISLRKTRSNKIHVVPQGNQSHANDDTPQYSSTEKAANQDEEWETPRRNKYKTIGKHIDTISFVVFFIVWISVSLGFLLNIYF
ncbi:neuronal acetylcholine receptor subunit alpha-6-like [Physella acuta]|uniref:neuronal acetylcholine receptor subunit alpha-6-like n=1 Tax=Physella acuta TaxID=109671 RepID=UPI0027DDF0FF|nr:neuronal acetylcholine receptor subunit alpha-6-like [Physella acuta]